MDTFVKKVADVAGNIGSVALNPLNPLGWFKAIGAVGKVVVAAEKICADKECDITGADRKEAVVKVLNDLIDIPILTENSEAKIIRAMIDAVVDLFNNTLGKKWGFALPN